MAWTGIGYKSWGFDGRESVDCDLLGYEAVVTNVGGTTYKTAKSHNPEDNNPHEISNTPSGSQLLGEMNFISEVCESHTFNFVSAITTRILHGPATCFRFFRPY
jgi:hypothetical protein